MTPGTLDFFLMPNQVQTITKNTNKPYIPVCVTKLTVQYNIQEHENVKGAVGEFQERLPQNETHNDWLLVLILNTANQSPYTNPDSLYLRIWQLKSST